jgi:hypothetical protein
MVVILRHDVDSAYVAELRFNRYLRYLLVRLNANRMRLGSCIPAISQLKYLQDAERLFELEKSLGIRGSWFFRRKTKPHLSFRKKLLSFGCEVSLHAETTRTENAFARELRSTLGEYKPLGFTKHGNAKNEIQARRMSCEIYDPENCLRLAREFGLRYFSGNGVNPEEPSRIVDGVIYFPSVFWNFPGYMDDARYTLEWLKRNHKDKHIVVLIHPREYTDLFPDLREKICDFLSEVDDIVSFREFLGRYGRDICENRGSVSR